MNYIDSNKIGLIKEALQMLSELSVPEHLQSAAFSYLLGSDEAEPKKGLPTVIPLQLPASPTLTDDLREYVAPLNLKTAVTEIPALLYWAMTKENTNAVDEKGVLELYRRAGLRPPKNILQAIRDLSSKKYGRLESVSGQPGYVRLSRVGETFVIHDVIRKIHK